MANLLDNILADDASTSSIFSAKPGGPIPTYDQLQNRRKIAQVLMAHQNQAYPKNVGEGLSSIGGDIANALYMRQLNAAEASKGAQDAAILKRVAPDLAPTSENVSTAAPASNVQTQTPVATADLAPEERGAGVVGSEFNAQDAAAPASVRVADGSDPWTARSQAIAGIESGGAKNPYTLLGATTRSGDRAYGKYQIMGANVPEWSQAALGQPLTPQQFLASPDAQEAVFKHRFGQYTDKYGEEGAARAWYGGEGGMKNLNATDVHGRLTVGSYGRDYLNRLNAGRDRMAATLQQRSEVPQSNPTQVAGGPDSSGTSDATDFSAQSRTPIVPAPQTSQVVPAPSYPTTKPIAPAVPGITRQMQDIQAALTTIGDPYQRQVLEDRLKQLQANQMAVFGQQQEEFKHQRERYENAPKEQLDLAKGQAALAKAADEARISQQFGSLPPAQVFEEMNKSKDEALKARNSLIAANEARKAINAGAITGYGAESKLDLAKLIVSLGGKDTGDRIKNTEVFRATIAPIIAGMRAATTGSGNFSDADRNFLERAAGGQITLDGDSIRHIMDLVERGSRLTLDTHQTKMDALFPNHPQGKALFGVDAPQIEKGPPLAPVQVNTIEEARRLTPGTTIILPDGRMGKVPPKKQVAHE